jgi:hypothetical protein
LECIPPPISPLRAGFAPLCRDVATDRSVEFIPEFEAGVNGNCLLSIVSSTGSVGWFSNALS